MKNKKILMPIIILLILIFIIFGIIEKKYYTKFNEYDFTIWNTEYGCYVIPYKYYGLLKPSDDYILIKRPYNLFLCFDQNNVLQVYCWGCYDCDTYIPEISLTKVDYEVHQWENDDDNTFSELEKYIGQPFLDYESKDNYVTKGTYCSKTDETDCFDSGFLWILQCLIVGLFK